jgi:hypothetical protein
MASMRPIDDHNSCDHCRSYLASGRLIAGGIHDRRQFCSFACYDRWHAGNIGGEPLAGGSAAKTN